MIAPLALNLGGAALTLSRRLAAVSGGTAEGLARVIGRRAEEGASQLTFAVVFPYSTHNYVLRDWLAEAGVRPDEDVRLVVAPPSRMAGLLRDGVIEGFCVGEPWNAAAAAEGVGEVVMRASQARPAAPDKVFAVGEAWAQANPETLSALVRALKAAGRWADAVENRGELVELLCAPEHVGAEPGAIAAGLADIRFVAGGASVPEPAHALWLLHQMARWGQIAPGAATESAAARVYRPSLSA